MLLRSTLLVRGEETLLLVLVVCRITHAGRPSSGPVVGAWQHGRSLDRGKHPFSQDPDASFFLAFPEIILK